MKHTPHNLATCTLTTLALATLLLTGCTQEKTSSASSSEVSQSTPAGSSSSSPSDQATSSPSPSPSESISYSGGSKAPAGEYRPADEFGPAQNVPRPVEPEGMNVESVEGMLAFIDYWNEWRNYASQTGDTSTIRNLVVDTNQREFDYYSSLDYIYSVGGWVIGGSTKIHYNKNLITSIGNGEYSIGGNVEVADSVLWVNGEARALDNSQVVYRGADIRVLFKDGSWKMVSVKEMR